MCSPLADFIFFLVQKLQIKNIFVSPLFEKVQNHFQDAFRKHLLHSYTGPAPVLV